MTLEEADKLAEGTRLIYTARDDRAHYHDVFCTLVRIIGSRVLIRFPAGAETRVQAKSLRLDRRKQA